MKKFSIPVIGVLLFLFLFSCKDDSSTDDPMPVVTYSPTYNDTIRHIINPTCNNSYCHGGGAGGILMGNYGQLKNLGESGLLMGAIKHEASYTPMPKDLPKLDQDKIDLIQQWVDEGYPES